MEQVKTTFIPVANRCPGVLYEPEIPGEKSRIAVLVMHSDEDYLTCPTGPELAKRGYRVLCANVPGKEGLLFTQMEKLHSVDAAVRLLRAMQGVEKVVLMGHSGGATLMTAYQALAENGAQVFRGPEKLAPYPEEVDFAGADGVMLFDPNWGNAAMQLFSLDAAVVDEMSGRKLDGEIDLFRPDNGFDPAGSTYPEEFIRRYQRAQSARNNRLIDHALERWETIQAGEGAYSDDEPLMIPGAAQGFLNNKLYAQDVRLMAHTRQPRKLIHPDRSVTTEIVHSLRPPENPVSLTHSMWEGARFLSVRTFLTSYAVRTAPDFGYDADHVWGVEWESSYACPPGNVKEIHCPLLVLGMTAGWEFLASETIYECAASEDKDIAFVEGATHKFNPAKHMEQSPGQFGDTMKTVHDYADGWLSAPSRF